MHRKSVKLLLLAAMFATTMQTVRAEDTSAASDEKAIRAQADAYTSAFGKGDATALAQMWTADGTYVDAEGREFKSREKIEKLFQAYFKDFHGETLKLEIESVRFPAPNVAVEDGSCTLLQRDVPMSQTKYSVVHVKDSTGWHMLNVIETNAWTRAKSLADLSWLIGSWSVSAKETPVTLKVDWHEDHHFIFADYHDNGQENVQILGWNPSTKEVVSWHYDAHGGFGNGKWYQIGDTWIENASGVRSDGKLTSATYILRKVGPDKFFWRSIDRNLDGQPMADSQEIEVTRTK